MGSAGLYAWLLDGVTADIKNVDARVNEVHAMFNKPHAEVDQVDRELDVRVGDLPAWARPGEPTYWWRRAIVTPADEVRYYDDDGTAFLRENGL